MVHCSRPAVGQWGCGQHWPKYSQRLDTSAAGFTRLEMYSTLCPNRSMVGQKLACRRSGKPPYAKKRSRPSTALLTLIRPSIRRRRRSSQKTVMTCSPSMTFLPNTGSTYERPIPLSRPSPLFGIEQLARAIAFRVQPSLASHSSGLSRRKNRGGAFVRPKKSLEGVPFKDGLPVTDSTPAQQPLAA